MVSLPAERRASVTWSGDARELDRSSIRADGRTASPTDFEQGRPCLMRPTAGTALSLPPWGSVRLVGGIEPSRELHRHIQHVLGRWVRQAPIRNHWLRRSGPTMHKGKRACHHEASKVPNLDFITCMPFFDPNQSQKRAKRQTTADRTRPIPATLLARRVISPPPRRPSTGDDYSAPPPSAVYSR